MRGDGMAERETTVGPKEGLHARPAAQFVKKAKQFSSDIVVIKSDKEANAKSSLKVMTLGAKKGDSITIRAEGEDAEEAVEALAELISADEH
jgi:phosphotransferase system HPr (HPr) family protein